MDETIRIQSIDKGQWTDILLNTDPSRVKRLLSVYSANGVAGEIYETVDAQYYINGQPETYTSLQDAAEALLQGKG